MKDLSNFKLDDESLSEISGGKGTTITTYNFYIESQGEKTLTGSLQIKNGKIVKEWGIVPDKYRKAALEK